MRENPNFLDTYLPSLTFFFGGRKVAEEVTIIKNWEKGGKKGKRTELEQCRIFTPLNWTKQQYGLTHRARMLRVYKPFTDKWCSIFKEVLVLIFLLLHSTEIFMISKERRKTPRKGKNTFFYPSKISTRQQTHEVALFSTHAQNRIYETLSNASSGRCANKRTTICHEPSN